MFPDGSDVELLDTRPPRPGRVRRQILGGLVIVAAAVAFVATRSGDHGTPRPPRTSSSPPPLTTQRASASPAGVGVVTSPDVAFARIGPTVYAVDDGTLITINLDTGLRREWPTAVPDADRYAVVADGGVGRVWLIAASETRTVIESLDATGLYVTGRYEPRGQYMDAAALYGRLYVGTTAGISVSSPTAVPAQLRPLVSDGQPLALATDPNRGRVLATIAGQNSVRIGAWRDGRVSPDIVASSPIGKGDLAVAGGRIWVGGFGRHGVLARLDPATLGVVRHSPLERDIGVGAVIVDAGTRHLLVRLGAATAGSATDLWCVDASTGAVTRHWGTAAGTAVLTRHGVVLLAPGQPLNWLPSVSCRG